MAVAPEFDAEDVVFVINPDGTVHAYLPEFIEEGTSRDGYALAHAILAILNDRPVLEAYIKSLTGRLPDDQLS